MSDSEELGVTYTDISSPFEELSDIGSPRADDHEHLMLPEMLKDPYVEVALQAPPSPDYIHGPEEPKQAPPSPDYVPGPEHADDEIVVEDQPYAEDASPIAQSPEYVPESDFEAHPEDDNDADPEEDPVDYPADGGDDGNDEEKSSEDDEDEEDDEMYVEADEEEEEHPAPTDSVVVAPTAVDQAPSVEETEPFETDESAATPPPHPAYRTTARISIPAPVPMPAWTNLEADEEEEEEHPAPADSVVVAPTAADQAPSAEETEPFETDESAATPPPHPAYRTTARISIPAPVPMPAWTNLEVVRLLAISSAPASPLSPCTTSSPIRSLGYRAAMIRLRDEAASISSRPLQLPSASRREDRPEVTLPPRKRLDIALGPR
uniref:Uncharacterized protein n=1 Tax=Tanacetum cinerariifolium TaxID=118510 RepID=A0A699L4I8_TANCI|nr:hypothetical protein [Tanacetum cinerariifolium]